MNIIITESQYSRIFLLEEDYRQTFKKYITNKNQGNAFRQWVRKNTDKYNLLVARMKQAKYSDPSLGPSGDITSPHIMLAWKMFGNDYINRNNVQSSGLSKQAQQDWQARQTMNKYFDPSNPDYVGKDHQVIDNTARLQSTYDSKTNTWSTKGNTNAGFSEREAANLAGVKPWCFTKEGGQKMKIDNPGEYLKLCPNPAPAPDAWDRMFNTLEEAWEYAKKIAVGAYEWTKEKLSWFVTVNLSKVMEGLRSFVTGTAGAVVNTILELTGIGALAVTAQWAALALYDYSKRNWIKFIFSILGLVTGGVLGKTLYKTFKGVWNTAATKVDDAISIVIKNPAIKSAIGNTINTIVKGVKTAADGIKSAGNWLINKFNITWARTGVNWIVNSLQFIIKKLTGNVEAEATKEAAKAIAQKTTTDIATKTAAKEGGFGSEYNTIKSGAYISKGGKSAGGQSYSVAGLNKAFN